MGRARQPPAAGSGPAASGPAGFEAALLAEFGARWPALRVALLQPRRHAVRPNPRRLATLGPVLAGLPRVAGIPGAYSCDAPLTDLGPEEAYFLDPASLRVAALVEAQPGDAVLDLCAAPGGKALCLADALLDADGCLAGQLHLNELSDARRRRLLSTLRAWLPAPAAAAIALTGHDGSRFGLHRPGAFDRILLDAPCSSERHVLLDAAALEAWTPARPRQLAQRQFALLCAAIDASSPGGRVVYATCALLDAENDAVVGRALSRRAGRVQVVALPASDLRLTGGEPTAHGWRWLPDTSGEGPMYAAVLEISADADVEGEDDGGADARFPQRRRGGYG